MHILFVIGHVPLWIPDGLEDLAKSADPRDSKQKIGICLSMPENHIMIKVLYNSKRIDIYKHETSSN